MNLCKIDMNRCKRLKVPINDQNLFSVRVGFNYSIESFSINLVFKSFRQSHNLVRQFIYTNFAVIVV